MNKLMSNSLTCLIISTSFYVTAALADIEETIEKTFSVKPNSEFSLHNINGAVELSSWSENTIKVIATIRADNKKAFERVVVDMQQKGNSVYVETEYEKEGFFSKSQNNADVDYEVKLPDSIASTYVDLVNGALTFTKINGDIKTDLVNGSTIGTGLSGNGKFNAVNGGIDISYSKLDEKVNKITMDTVNGGIKLTLPRMANARINAETMNGGIQNDFGFVVDKQGFSNKELSGIVGNGHTSINIDSVNGGIKILRLE